MSIKNLASYDIDVNMLYVDGICRLCNSPKNIGHSVRCPGLIIEGMNYEFHGLVAGPYGQEDFHVIQASLSRTIAVAANQAPLSGVKYGKVKATFTIPVFSTDLESHIDELKGHGKKSL